LKHKHEAVCLVERQGSKQDRFEDTEDSRIRPDTQGQRQYRDGCKTRVLSERPNGVAKVLLKRVDHWQSPLVSVPVLHLRDAAKIAPGGETSLVLRHPAANMLVHQ
jgi:hypothetical protein